MSPSVCSDEEGAPRLPPPGNRRASAITRAERAALSFSKPPLSPPDTTGPAGAGKPDKEPGEENTAAKPAGATTREATASSARASPTDAEGVLRRALLKTPLPFPDGDGGYLRLQLAPGPARAGERPARTYRMDFGQWGASAAPREASVARDGPRSCGLEAVGGGETGAFLVRGLYPDNPGHAADRAAVAKIEAAPGDPGDRWELYKLVLGDELGGRDVMAVRVAPEPSGQAAPRSVEAVVAVTDGAVGHRYRPDHG